jgi:hypothetical protein
MTTKLGIASKEVETMKKLLMAVAALAIAGAAFAGPNAGGTIFAADANMAYTTDITDYCGLGTVPSDCASADIRMDDTAGFQVWKVYAAFVSGSSPRLKAVVFGVYYDADIVISAGAFGACAEFELPDDTWPASGSGNSLVWDNTQTDELVEVYWFGGYNYYGTATSFGLGINQGQGAGQFADDSIPSVVDDIAGYGTLGFNMDGTPACPEAPTEGACCLPDGTCMLTLPDQCDGDFLGGVCDPNPCQPQTGACCLADGSCIVTTADDCDAQGGTSFHLGMTCDEVDCTPVPVLEGSWGQIKNTYR